MSCVLFRASKSHIIDKKLSDLKSDFTLTLGYPNPALNNPAQVKFIENLLLQFASRFTFSALPISLTLLKITFFKNTSQFFY